MNKKVFIISSEFPPGPGGIGQHTSSMLKAWPSGDEIVLLTNQDYSSSKESSNYVHSILRPGQILVKFISRSSRLYIIKRILQAFILFYRHRPQLMIVSGKFPLVIGALIKLSFRKVKIKAILHGSELASKGIIHDILFSYVLKTPDSLYPVSKFTSRLLFTYGDFNNVHIVPNGIDLEMLEDAKKNNSLKSRLKGSPKILTVGNVTFRKGQQRMIRAMPELLSELPNAHYHVVGLPTQKKAMMEDVKRLGVQDAVTFHGRVDRKTLYDFYFDADIFVMLSENQQDGDVEGFGIAIIEANAFGLPAVGAAGCGIEDAIVDNSGFLVDGDNILDIVKSFKAIMSNFEIFRAGSIKWAESHTWDKLVLKISECD